MKPKVSVIIGIYNCASYLQEALDSLYNQTFQDFEIILCDDGSSDNTYEIAKANASSHSNIVLLRNNKNKGLNYTLNKCLKEAKGEYIARMDGDDISLPTRFEKEIEFLDKNKAYDIVSCGMIYFDDNGEFMRNKVNEYPEKKDLIKGTIFCHAPCMVRTAAYRAVDGYTEKKRLLRMEDYHLWFKMYAHGYKGHNINEALYMMRDDRNAFKRRTFRSRLNEAYVRFIGYKMLKLPLYSYIFCLRPIIVGLLPNFIYEYFHRKR